MFNQPKIPAPEQKPLGVEPSRLSTNESAIPLPWAVGKNRLALRWISPAYNQRTTAITQRVGKRNQTTGYNVYADVAGAICAGPVDQLESILIDGVVVWASANAVRNATNPHYYQGTVPGYGTFRIYWGTSTQPKDTLILNYSTGTEVTWDNEDQPWEFPNRSGTSNQSVTYTTTACPDDHPAYLDQCYMVWSQLFCGQNRESVPNVEVIVAKAARPFPELDPDITDEGVNPVFAVAEILTNDLYGAGLPASALDVVQWNNVATTAANLRTFARPTAPNTPVSVPFGHISPIVERQVTVKQILNELFAYFDGYVRPRNGMLEIGHFPHDGVTPTGLTTLTLQDDTALPEYQPGSWNDTISQATVVHRDYALQHKENAETCQQPLALAITGQPKRESINRPYFVTRWQAQDYAARWARIHAHPANLVRGRIRVRTERAVHSSGQPLLAGDRFIFDYTPYSLQIVARITSRQDDSTGGEVTLQFEAERGLAPLPYVMAGDNRPAVQQVVPVAITNARFFQLPTGYLGEPTPAIVPLAERPGAAMVGFNAFWSTSGSTYDLLGQVQHWAVRGTLVSGINSAATSLTLSASGLDLAKLQGQSSDAQADNTLLLFLGNEVLSVGTVTALGGGQYTVDVLRGRYGSTAASHSTSAVAYVIPRSELAVYTNANFPRSASARYFKLQTYTFNDQQDLSAAFAITFTFLDRTVAAPTGLTASGVAGGVLFEWTNPNDPDFEFAELYVSTTTTKPATPTYSVPGIPGAKGSYRVEPVAAGQTRYGWVHAADTSANKSPTGPGPVSAQAATAGADAYNVILDMPAPIVRCDSSGNAVSGELGAGGRVRTSVFAYKGGTALTPTTGTPGAGQYRVLANGAPVNSTATISSGYIIQLDSATADTGLIYYKVELETTAVFYALNWSWSKTKDGAAGANGTNGTNGTNGAGYGGTSSTSLALGTGSKTLTTQTGLAYTAGDLVRVKYTSDPAQWMEGVVTSYTSATGSLTFTSNLYVGNGTYSTWIISLAGQSGTGGVYVGEYNAGNAYYQDSVRFDIVSVSGTYYRANNPSKSGSATWGNPTSSSDWISAGTTLKFAASDLFLARDATVLKTLVMGDGTPNAGIIRSSGASLYSSGTGFWLGYDSTTAKFRVGNPSGNRLTWDGTQLNVVGDFSAGSGDRILNATSTATTIGNTSQRHFSFQQYASGTTTFVARNSTTDLVTIGAYDIGAGLFSGLIEVKTSSGSTCSLAPGAISVSGTVTSTGQTEAGSFKTSTFEAGVTTAVDVKSVNLRVYSGATQTARIDYTNGRYYVQGNAVLNTRYGSTPTDTATIIACLQHHGLCP